MATAPLGHPERAGQVGVDHVEEGLLAHAQHQRVHGDAGVGHQHLDRAPPLLDRAEGRLDLLRVAHVAAHGQEAVRVGAVGRLRWVGRAEGRGDRSPLARNHSTQAAPMPRVPPVTRTTAISACRARGARRGAGPPAPARRRRPASRMTWPAKGVRTSETPTRPTRSADVDGGRRRSGRPAGPGQQPRPGRLQGGLGAEDAARRADDDPLGHVEVLALVQCRLGPPGPGSADLVHQGVEVLGLGHGQRLDLGQAALGQPAEHPTRPELDERGEPEAGERLERLAPAHRAAELGREQTRATRRGRRARARRRWPRPGPRGPGR